MGKTNRTWHPLFIKYMEYIASHQNYKGLSISRKQDGGLSWIATKKSIDGKSRIAWALNKAKALGIPNKPGVYAKVMLNVHPKKSKICQVCGQEMSLYYVYLNQALVNSIIKVFNIECTTTTNISSAVDALLEAGVEEKRIITFLLSKFKLPTRSDFYNLTDLLDTCEKLCREGSSKMLGPGAMSNFPDRFDGFHTYNRCCRASEDTGRSKENLKTYTKDRRAYEFWSDGNIHAANTFMGSAYFEGHSADHVGPISLGFIHDPSYLKKLTRGDNTAKRDRLTLDDVESIVSIENATGIHAVSWYSTYIWEDLKKNYKCNPDKIDDYRLILKQNVTNYLTILWVVANRSNGKGRQFLVRNILEPKFDYFKYSYQIDANGAVTSKTKRNITDATRKEISRFIRIAFEAIEDYQEKDNRNVKTSLDNDDLKLLKEICNNISLEKQDNYCLQNLEKLIKKIQLKLLEAIK